MKIHIMKTVSEGTRQIIMRRARMEGLDVLFQEHSALAVLNGNVCDLIYATDSATIEINGGTFKAVTPANTLNVLDKDRGKAKIIVKGGSFYKYDPSHPTSENEVFVADGYKVVQEGDWYKVVAE